MKFYSRLSLISLLTACLLLPFSALAVNIPGPLVETDWLESNLDKVKILDVRKKAADDTKRIKGATLIPWKKVRGKKQVDGVELIKMLPSKADFEALMQSVGVNNDSTIVITSEASDESKTFLGTRLYWQLKYFGHDNIALLNGGNAKWFAEKRASATESPAIDKGDFVAKEERKKLLATTADVEKALESKQKVLLDSRSEDMYLGLYHKHKYVYAAGHIPGAKSAAGNTFLKHGKVKTFHDPEKIKMALKAKGIDPAAESIAFCNSGHLASGLWFISHELLGNKEAALYDGSMHAWTKDKSRPVVSMKME